MSRAFVNLARCMPRILHLVVSLELTADCLFFLPIENFSTFPAHVNAIRNESKIYSATGEGRIPWVSADDVAAVAARALTDPDPPNTEYQVLGPELLSYGDVGCSSLCHQIPMLSLLSSPFSVAPVNLSLAHTCESTQPDRSNLNPSPRSARRPCPLARVGAGAAAPCLRHARRLRAAARRHGDGGQVRRRGADQRCRAGNDWNGAAAVPRLCGGDAGCLGGKGGTGGGRLVLGLPYFY
jgi:hypothetical protein